MDGSDMRDKNGMCYCLVLYNKLTILFLFAELAASAWRRMAVTCLRGASAAALLARAKATRAPMRSSIPYGL
jgi:hypothetical protein